MVGVSCLVGLILARNYLTFPLEPSDLLSFRVASIAAAKVVPIYILHQTELGVIDFYLSPPVAMPALSMPSRALHREPALIQDSSQPQSLDQSQGTIATIPSNTDHHSTAPFVRRRRLKIPNTFAGL